MATSKEYIDYVLECLSHIEGISARKMFGDYGLYMFNRVMGLVCDDQVSSRCCRAAREYWARTLPLARHTMVLSLITSFKTWKMMKNWHCFFALCTRMCQNQSPKNLAVEN